MRGPTQEPARSPARTYCLTLREEADNNNPGAEMTKDSSLGCAAVAHPVGGFTERKGTNLLKPEMEERLNEQFNLELYSAYLYYAMTAYFESLSLKGFSHWMSLQAQEELLHVSKLFQHINDRAGRVVFNAVEAPPNVWESPLKVMEAAYAHECLVSERINEEVSFALSLNDHTSVTFLQWFVAEQVEEESVADDIVQKLKIIGDNSSALFLLDQELGQRPAVSIDAEAGDA